MRRQLFVLIMAVSLSCVSDEPMAKAENPNPPATEASGDWSGAHDFDFLMGDWRVHHRVNKAGAGAPWVEFDSECSERPLIGGRANVEEHRFEKPGGVSYGVAVLFGQHAEQQADQSEIPLVPRGGRQTALGQAYSDDGGSTWAVNWVMDFEPSAPR